MNKKRMIKALMLALSTMVLQVSYAAPPLNVEHMNAYRCASVTEPLQRVYVNLGGNRGFVPLDVPVTHMQPVSINVLKQCLLQNGLMSKQEFASYRQALEVCRNEHKQKKAQFSRGSITNISTSESFNFDHCLQDNLVN